MATDEAVVVAVGPMGSRTWAIAMKLGISTQAARRSLARLEAIGRVSRHPRYSAINDIYWQRADAPQSGVTATDAELGPGNTQSKAEPQS